LNAEEPLLGSSEKLLGFARHSSEEPSDYLKTLGAAAGWNVLDYEGVWNSALEGLISEGVTQVLSVPDGTNSTNGPLIEVGLLPRESGTVPVSSSVMLPGGTLISGLYYNSGSFAPSAPLVQSQPLSVSAPGPAGDWAVAGPPPSDHLGSSAGVDLGLAAELLPPLGSLYSASAWFDGEADGSRTGSACDLVLAEATDRLLVWMEASSLQPTSAFAVQRSDVPLGWSLYDIQASAFRVLSLGLSITPDGAEVVVPLECLPPSGDDDDSAGDDDDSAAEDPSTGN
jgi:hypothetical protein